jgi:hypothetical protein
MIRLGKMPSGFIVPFDPLLTQHPPALTAEKIADFAFEREPKPTQASYSRPLVGR